MYFINTILFGFSLIILAAVRKGYKWSAGSSHDIARTPLRLKTWRNDAVLTFITRISRGNLPVALKLENIIIS